MLQKIINFSLYSIVFLMPFYLVRFKIGWVPFNLVEICIYILFFLWLFFGKKPKLISQDRFWIYPSVLILIGVSLSTIFSSDVQISAGIWKGWFIAPILFTLLLASSLENKRQIRNILIALTLSGLGAALIAFYYWLTNNLTYDGRLKGFYLSANHLAMYLSPILILSLGLYSFFKKRIYKIILLIVHSLFFFVIYLTYSYGAWLGLLVGFLYVLARQKNKKASLIFLGLVILVLILQFPSQKFQSFLGFSYPSVESRLVIYQSASEILKDHALIGIGPGMFQKYYLEYQPKFKPYPEWAVPQPHNLFLAFWLQIGLLGLMGLIGLLIHFFKTSFQNKKKPLFIFLLAAMLYILVHGLVDTPYFKSDLAILFWLIIALNYTLHLKSDIE